MQYFVGLLSPRRIQDRDCVVDEFTNSSYLQRILYSVNDDENGQFIRTLRV